MKLLFSKNIAFIKCECFKNLPFCTQEGALLIRCFMEIVVLDMIENKYSSMSFGTTSEWCPLSHGSCLGQFNGNHENLSRDRCSLDIFISTLTGQGLTDRELVFSHEEFSRPLLVVTQPFTISWFEGMFILFGLDYPEMSEVLQTVGQNNSHLYQRIWSRDAIKNGQILDHRNS